MVQDRVRRFIKDELNWDGGGELTDDFPLIERQVLDSLGIFQLVSFLEEEFGIEVLDEELIPENFGTIEGIARLVSAKRTG